MKKVNTSTALYAFFFAVSALFVIVSLFVEPINTLLPGLWKICTFSEVLTVDSCQVGGLNGAMLNAGATTFWEDFDLDWARDGARIDEVLAEGAYDIHGDNGKFCYVGLRHSLCHGWSAGPTAFLADTVLGIEILEAGCKKIAIKPQLGDLEWARGTYPTPYGDITVSVTRDGADIQAPAEIEIVR